MSDILDSCKEIEQCSRRLDNNNNHKDEDIDQFHHKIIQSMKVSTLRQQSRDQLEQSWLPYRRIIKTISKLTHIPSDILNNYARTIFFLILLGLMFPFNLLITLFTFVLSNFINIIQHKQSTTLVSNPNSKRILISGGRMTKALQLCRAFYRAGHQIVLVDESINWLTGHRWSNSVERFYVHPSPREETEDYIKTLANIVRKEKIHIFIPIIPTYNSQIDAQLRSALAVHGCLIFDINTDELTAINNKYTFIEKARSLGLTVPESFRMISRNQLLNFDFNNEHRFYICKSALFDDLHHRATIKLPQSTRAATVEYINKLPISEDSPYILQEFISGEEYSTHMTCINGELTLFICTSSSPSHRHYKHIEHPAILEWCIQYIQTLKLTGHISFDFIVNNHDGKPYAIGCYPYVNSAITSFYNHPKVADAYFPSASTPCLLPLTTARFIYWFPHELWHLFRNIRSIKTSMKSLKTLFYGKEAIWSWDDPFPFLFHYHIHIFYLLFENLFSKHVRFFNKIDFSTGTLA